MGERLEDFYKNLRIEVARMELAYLQHIEADEERIKAAKARCNEQFEDSKKTLEKGKK